MNASFKTNTETRPDLSTPKQRLEKIVEDGLCVGCGLCASLARDGCITMKTSPFGYLRPHVNSKIDEGLVDTVYDVCPGLRQDSLPEHLLAQDTTVDPIWGPIRAMFSAHAADERTRIKAASGGVLSALAKYLLASKQVDFILHARPSNDDVTFGVAHISRNEDEVDQGTGSIYGPTAPLVNILSLLDQGKPFAYIGKPCDISALRNYAPHDRRVEELIKFWLTPVCGGIVPPPQLDSFLASRDTSRQELTSFRYRGDGCPGDTEFTTKDGSTGSANMYEPYGGIEESSWQLPFRCKICPDGPGESADIAAGDQWIDDVPDWEFAKIDKGTNAVIVRTTRGEELYNAAVGAGYINTEKTITPRFYDTCQHHHVVKKMYTRARWNGLAQAGSLVPSSQGLRLDVFFDANTHEENTNQSEGTIRRVPDGRERI